MVRMFSSGILIYFAAIGLSHADDRIVGGEDVAIEEVPYQVSLAVGNYLCGGSLIKEQYILTAAHCVCAGETASDITVRLGSSFIDSGGITREVSEIVCHENYGNLDFDIAILKLATPITEEDRLLYPIDIIPLGISIPPNGGKVTVSGFGTLSSGGNIPDSLQRVAVCTFSHKLCQKKYAKIGIIISDRMICAGWPCGGKDSCQGDSGGPLVNYRGELIGVVSFGESCALAEFPGVYTSVPRLIPWIEQHTSD